MPSPFFSVCGCLDVSGHRYQSVQINETGESPPTTTPVVGMTPTSSGTVLLDDGPARLLILEATSVVSEAPDDSLTLPQTLPWMEGGHQFVVCFKPTYTSNISTNTQHVGTSYTGYLYMTRPTYGLVP